MFFSRSITSEELRRPGNLIDRHANARDDEGRGCPVNRSPRVLSRVADKFFVVLEYFGRYAH